MREVGWLSTSVDFFERRPVGVDMSKVLHVNPIRVEKRRRYRLNGWPERLILNTSRTNLKSVLSPDTKIVGFLKKRYNFLRDSQKAGKIAKEVCLL